MKNPLQKDVAKILPFATELPVEEVIKYLVKMYPEKATFSSSFSFEDQVITHKILTNQLPVSIFTLDTDDFLKKLILCGALPMKDIIPKSGAIILTINCWSPS